MKDNKININKTKVISILFFILLVFSKLYASGNRDYEMKLDNIKVKVFKRTGNVCLYALPETQTENKKYIPLYNDESSGRGNKFFVYYNGKAYELNKPAKIIQDNYSTIVLYKFEGRFIVQQRISFISKKYGMSASPLKIETTVKNIGKHPADVAIKALFDTNLGEDKAYPIYTDLKAGISSEKLLDPKKEADAAIISASSDLACIFLIKHSKATPMDKIYIANWDRLITRSWRPKVIEGRSFSTKYFRNDSAVLFTWPVKRLIKSELESVTMFIGCYDYVKEKLEEKNKGKNRHADEVNVSGTKGTKYDAMEELESNELEEAFVDLSEPIEPMNSKKEQTDAEDEEEELEEAEEVFIEAPPSSKKKIEEIETEYEDDDEDEYYEDEDDDYEIEEVEDKPKKTPKQKRPKKKVKKVKKNNDDELDVIKKIPVDNSYTKKEYMEDYAYVKTLLKKIEEVEKDSDSVSDEYIEDLTQQADSAINDISKDDNN